MKVFRATIPVGLIIMALIGGCAVSRPLGEPTLMDEANRYAAAFKRDMKLGRYSQALSDARRALEVNRILDREVQIAVSLNNLGTVQERLRLSEAAASYREAVELSRKAGDVRVLAVSLNNFSGMVVEFDPEEAEIQALEAFEIGRTRSWTDVKARALHTRARAALTRGDVKEGRALCTEALAHASTLNGKGIRAACLVTLGRVEALAGNTTAAVNLVEKALVIDRDLADPYPIAMDYIRLAEIQDMAGDTESAGISRGKAEGILRILGISGTESE